jgi:hypothetical protein
LAHKSVGDHLTANEADVLYDRPGSVYRSFTLWTEDFDWVLVDTRKALPPAVTVDAAAMVRKNVANRHIDLQEVEETAASSRFNDRRIIWVSGSGDRRVARFPDGSTTNGNDAQIHTAIGAYVSGGVFADVIDLG